jgi:hypothetical protein
VQDTDLALRRDTYRLVAELGRVPTAADVARETRRPLMEVRSGWRRLHEAHAVVLDASGDELRMANPFSAVPTTYRVRAGGRWWFANCAWDAFGVCAALGVDGRVETACADCGEPLSVQVRSARPVPDDALFHCLVPASSWWEDIGFT